MCREFEHTAKIGNFFIGRTSSDSQHSQSLGMRGNFEAVLNPMLEKIDTFLAAAEKLGSKQEVFAALEAKRRLEEFTQAIYKFDSPSLYTKMSDN